MKVTSKISHASFKVYVNDILHLHVARETFLGLSSWLYEKEEMYYIEIMLNGGNITVDYDRCDLWIAVLSELEKIK